MAKYISYWDCSGWSCTVEVMNIQNHDAKYRITVYDRTGNNSWSDTRNLAAHGTERVALCQVQLEPHNGTEGLVIVEPSAETAEEFPDAEFPSMLTICDEGRHWKIGNRFVNFIRVP